MKAIGREFRWRKMLDEGIFSTIKELAATKRIDPSYVRDMLRLTLLALDFIEMIPDGRQPQAFQFESLRKSLPLAWEEQLRTISGEGCPAMWQCDREL